MGGLTGSEHQLSECKCVAKEDMDGYFPGHWLLLPCWAATPWTVFFVHNEGEVTQLKVGPVEML